MRRMGLGVLAGGLLFLVGCDTGTFPGLPDVEQILVLEEVGGESLPATVEEAPGYIRVYRQDVIRLLDNDTWERTQVQDFTYPGSDTQALTLESDGHIERVGDELVLAFVCNDTASCVAPERLVPAGDGYVIQRYPGSMAEVTLRYRVEPMD